MPTIPPTSTRARTRIAVFLALVFASVWAAGRIHSIRDQAEVSRMLADTRTVCVGRFLVDLPTQARVAFSHERIAGFRVEINQETGDAFNTRLSARERDIAARGASSDDEGGLDAARDLHIPNMTGRAFVYGRSRGYLMNGDRRVDMESVSIEAHGHRDGYTLSLTARDSTEDRLKVAEALLSRVRLLRDNEIPPGPGVCMGRALFEEPLPPHKTEHVAIHIDFDAHPDIAMTFSSMPGGLIGPGLLARYADMDAQASLDEVVRATKLRRTARVIHGIGGEEVLEQVRELNRATTYGFVWEAHGMVDQPSQPFLSLELQAGRSVRPGGKPVDTSLHADAVVALWDQIASSIRVQPSTPPAPSTAQR